MLKIIYIYFIVNYLFLSFAHFYIGIVFFYPLLIRRSSLQITEIISFLECEWHIYILSVSFVILPLIHFSFIAM